VSVWQIKSSGWAFLFCFLFFEFLSLTAVFHEKDASSHQQLSVDLQNISRLLHHFRDNIEDNDPDDLNMAETSSACAHVSIDKICATLSAGQQGPSGSWSDDQRDTMAYEFKILFEHLVMLMQLSEAQQAKKLMKNIRITQETLANVYNTRYASFCIIIFFSFFFLVLVTGFRFCTTKTCERRWK
jgi:hypothetical protein